MKNEYIIGIDIGGTRTKSGLVNLATGEVPEVVVQPTEKAVAARFISQLGEVMDAFKKSAGQRGYTIGGIGMGVPGFTAAGGVVATTYGFLPFMENYPLQHIVEENFSLPCCIDNDARAIALGEALFGKGKGADRVLVLTLGTGVGYGFVVNGRFSDAMPFSHMGGNITVTDEGGECYCGKKGCLEALVSSAGIIHLAEKAGLVNVAAARDVFDRAEAGAAGAVEVIRKVVHYLHTAIHNYVNLFAPDVIVLGGGIAKSLSPYLTGIKGRSYLGPYPGYDFNLFVSELQEEAGMLGSAALFHHILTPKAQQ